MKRRERGSVRFDPYYKVQVWDPITMAWRDIQRRHDTFADAEAAFVAGKRCRVMVVTEGGRHAVVEN